MSRVDSNEVLALYDYEGSSATELSFRKGDKIVVYGQYDKHWWKGQVGDDQVGMFPASYVVGLERFDVEESDDGDGVEEKGYQDTEVSAVQM